MAVYVFLVNFRWKYFLSWNDLCSHLMKNRDINSAVTWLKYCRYVRHKTLSNQSINQSIIVLCILSLSWNWKFAKLIVNPTSAWLCPDEATDVTVRTLIILASEGRGRGAESVVSPIRVANVIRPESELVFHVHRNTKVWDGDLWSKLTMGPPFGRKTNDKDHKSQTKNDQGNPQRNRCCSPSRRHFSRLSVEQDADTGGTQTFFSWQFRFFDHVPESPHVVTNNIFNVHDGISRVDCYIFPVSLYSLLLVRVFEKSRNDTNTILWYLCKLIVKYLRFLKNGKGKQLHFSAFR